MEGLPKQENRLDRLEVLGREIAELTRQLLDQIKTVMAVNNIILTPEQLEEKARNGFKDYALTGLRLRLNEKIDEALALAN